MVRSAHADGPAVALDSFCVPPGHEVLVALSGVSPIRCRIIEAAGGWPESDGCSADAQRIALLTIAQKPCQEQLATPLSGRTSYRLTKCPNLHL